MRCQRRWSWQGLSWWLWSLARLNYAKLHYNTTINCNTNETNTAMFSNSNSNRNNNNNDRLVSKSEERGWRPRIGYVRRPNHNKRSMKAIKRSLSLSLSLSLTCTYASSHVSISVCGSCMHPLYTCVTCVMLVCLTCTTVILYYVKSSDHAYTQPANCI